MATESTSRTPSTASAGADRARPGADAADPPSARFGADRAGDAFVARANAGPAYPGPRPAPDAFLTHHQVRPSTTPGLTLENQHCVRATVDGTLLARQGAMVAYRGELTIQTKGQGVKKLLKRAVTGEGLALMEVEGRGEMWLAELAKNVAVLRVTPEDGLSVAGKGVLAFDAAVAYEISRIKGAGMAGGGLFTCRFSGDGAVAVTADGEPLVIPVTPDAPVFVDTDAVVGWSSSLSTAVQRSESAKSFLKGGSGEMFQLRLEGEGVVIVQPSEGPLKPKGDSGGDVIEELLGG